MTALETPTLESFTAAASAWAELSPRDRGYLSRHMTGRWSFVDDFTDGSRERGLRVAYV